MKSLIFIFLSIVLSFSAYGNNSFNKELKTLDSYMQQSKFKSASKQVLHMLSKWGDNKEILSRVNRLNTLAKMESEFDNSYELGAHPLIQKIREREAFYQKFNNPSTSEIILGALATATVYLGAQYVSSWVDAQENPSNNLSNKSVISVQIQTGHWMSSTTLDDFKVELHKKIGSSTHLLKVKSAGSGVFEKGYAGFYNIPSGNYVLKMYGEKGINRTYYGETPFSYSGGRVTCIAKMAEDSFSCRYH